MFSETRHPSLETENLCSLFAVTGWLVIASDARALEGGRQASVCMTDIQASDTPVSSFSLQKARLPTLPQALPQKYRAPTRAWQSPSVQIKVFL